MDGVKRTQSLMHILQSLLGISGTILYCPESYLIGKTKTVTVNGRSSEPADVFFVVLQGSVLGSIHFILYSAPLCLFLMTQRFRS